MKADAEWRARCAGHAAQAALAKFSRSKAKRTSASPSAAAVNASAITAGIPVDWREGVVGHDLLCDLADDLIREGAK